MKGFNNDDDGDNNNNKRSDEVKSPPPNKEQFLKESLLHPLCSTPKVIRKKNEEISPQWSYYVESPSKFEEENRDAFYQTTTTTNQVLSNEELNKGMIQEANSEDIRWLPVIKKTDSKQVLNEIESTIKRKCPSKKKLDDGNDNTTQKEQEEPEFIKERGGLPPKAKIPSKWVPGGL
jgi:ribonuclease HI